jgi:hypothetical protein
LISIDSSKYSIALYCLLFLTLLASLRRSRRRRGVLALLVVFLEFLLGLKRSYGDDVDVQGGDGLVVLFGNVGIEVGEGMDWAVGGHEHIGTSQQVLQDVGLVDFVQHFVMSL